MSRKLGVVMVMLILLAGWGCVANGVTSPRTQEVIVKVQGPENTKVDVYKKVDEIRRIMNVPYTEPELPKSAYIVGDTCYYSIWVYITTGDALDMFKTFRVCDYKGIKKIHILINSGGGSAFDGMAVADLIVRATETGMDVTTEASGVVASAAVPIFAVGGKRIASKGTIFMIHEGKLTKFLASEGKDDLRSQQEMMDIEETRYNSIIASKTKLSIEQIKEMCRRTTWFTADKAKEWGFVDVVK